MPDSRSHYCFPTCEQKSDNDRIHYTYRLYDLLFSRCHRGPYGKNDSKWNIWFYFYNPIDKDITRRVVVFECQSVNSVKRHHADYREKQPVTPPVAVDNAVKRGNAEKQHGTQLVVELHVIIARNQQNQPQYHDPYAKSVGAQHITSRRELLSGISPPNSFLQQSRLQRAYRHYSGYTWSSPP